MIWILIYSLLKRLSQIWEEPDEILIAAKIKEIQDRLHNPKDWKVKKIHTQTIKRMAKAFHEFRLYRGTRKLKFLTIRQRGWVYDHAYRTARVILDFDSTVTMDVHRLIRYPGSLHGGTGLRVTLVPWETIDDFDPLIDAVAFDTDRTIEVQTTRAVEVDLCGNDWIMDPGTHQVPEPVGIFLMGRRMGVLV